jgi:hypothetical protein
MADEPENLILHQLRALDAKMDRRFDKLEGELAAVRGELKSFREDVAATDSENAKILETITHDIADLKTIFVDLQARVVRDEKRIKALEKPRPAP